MVEPEVVVVLDNTMTTETIVMVMVVMTMPMVMLDNTMTTKTIVMALVMTMPMLMMLVVLMMMVRSICRETKYQSCHRCQCVPNHNTPC